MHDMQSGLIIKKKSLLTCTEVIKHSQLYIGWRIAFKQTKHVNAKKFYNSNINSQ